MAAAKFVASSRHARRHPMNAVRITKPKQYTQADKKPAKRAGPKTVRPENDWSRFDAMSDEKVIEAALSDPDAQPLTPADAKRMRRAPQAKVIRQALGVSRGICRAFWDSDRHAARLGARAIRARPGSAVLSQGDRSQTRRGPQGTRAGSIDGARWQFRWWTTRPSWSGAC